MSGAETVNDEFEVGFNQTFELHWYRAEQAGRLVMILFTLAAGLGLLGRGPFSHATAQSASHALGVNYEPISHDGTATTVTVHIKKPRDASRVIELRVNQQMIEPMGYERTVPLANNSSVTDDGMRLAFTDAANQSDILARFQLKPSAVGFIPLHLSDGTDTIDWSVLVVP
ncbi:MAG: hypothetical protein M3Y22_04230 [Pseudomonadota bacterium]|nr:hypothetical protein [Pseudomonadota bacterium]